MNEMWNVAMQRGWFGPHYIPDIYPTDGHECRKVIGPMGHPVFLDPECEEHAGVVYDDGPFDGLKTTSMWAQRFAQIPIVNYAQARPLMAGRRMGEEKPVFCRPGYMPVPTGVPGQSKCVPYSAPSAMIGPSPMTTVSSTVPASYTPGQLTYPLKPFWGVERT